MVSQTNEQVLEAAIEKYLTGTCLEEKNKIEEEAPFTQNHGGLPLTLIPTLPLIPNISGNSWKKHRLTNSKSCKRQALTGNEKYWNVLTV